jgi:hypothetical protein
VLGEGLLRRAASTHTEFILEIRIALILIGDREPAD